MKKIAKIACSDRIKLLICALLIHMNQAKVAELVYALP